MRYMENKVEDLKIAYIGGGSRGWAWSLMSDLSSQEELSGIVKLYDIDYEAAHNNEIIGNKMSKLENAKSIWNYKAVKDIQEALQGADFVVISILPGTFKEMNSDVHCPEKYGIYQSVGDTTGPGGIMRALRTIPMYVEIAENIKKYSPEAWVINYTNPMALCTRTLYEVFPEVKAFGCCHEVFGTQDLLAKALEKIKGISGVKRHEIKINVLGVNHFTWINKASYLGIDIFPAYKEFVHEFYETGFSEDGGEHWINNYFACAQRVKFDLFQKYGVIAAAGDRHLAEFMPPWYLKNPETVAKWKFSLTPVEWRINHQNELITTSKKLVSGEEKVEIKRSGEEGVSQMKAILGLGGLITNVNLPNKGQVEGVQSNAVVETNALFTRNSVRPILSGKLPDPVQNMVVRHSINHETILKAALKKDKELAFGAFMNDPLMTLEPEQGRKLFDEMLYNTKEYLDGWNLK